ncbi:hypothetical protein LDENG_00203000 [Lucifuga dentata]|nr:hypothetical protein LDENG_00203000 [Lucifuga dentata]
MAEESDLEKRAVDELLRETDRARVRAETMGPAGWLKCPLQSTNKRFLINTLRSTGLQRRTAQPAVGQSATRGRPRRESLDRSRSRTPPRDLRANRGHRDYKDHYKDSHKDRDKRQEKDEDRCYRYKHKARDRRHREGGQNRDGKRLHKDFRPAGSVYLSYAVATG